MKIRKTHHLLRCLTLLLALLTAAGAFAETDSQRDKRMAWFREARFGMFIHWGVYSVPAGEWNGQTNYGEWFLEETKMPVSQYEKYAARFNPVQFDADQWVKMAKDAGMKYLVITSKHHDGFGLWPSDQTDWCIRNTPFKRDPLRELAQACKKHKVRLCFYHSIMDWHHPDWGTRRAWNDKASGTPDMDRYVPYMKAQLKELITGYGPLGILWFDGEWESAWTHERGVDLYNYVRSLQPSIIINNRVGKGRAGMSGMDTGAERVGDYGTPEQEIPPTGFGPGVDWESCMTMNNHWGFNKNDQNWKSSATLIRNLVDCASKGGNYLLNVGPTAEGAFPQPSIERLAAIGKWMKVNGEAIYDTQASPFKRLPFGRCTTKVSGKTTTLYLHVFDWPTDGQLVIPGLKNNVKKAYLLADSKHRPLKATLGEDSVVLSVPSTAPDAAASVVVLKIREPLKVEAPGLVQKQDGTVLLPAIDAITHGDTVRYESGKDRDNLGFWTNPSDWVEWSFQVKRPGKFQVLADIATLGSSSFVVSCEGQELPATVTSTGNYGSFKTFELGPVELSTTGKTSLTVRPKKDHWEPVNLRSIKLLPIGQQ